jgi:hypothetical protein
MSRERPWERRTVGATTSEPGSTLIRLSWAGTLVSCATSIANAVTGDRKDYWLSAAPALVLLALGCVAFLWAFAVAVERSRTEAIGVGGLFFLEGCAPRRVQLVMMASVAVQTVVPLTVAIIRPFTAFAVLAPVWALGLAGLWGARHGTFPPRSDATTADRPDSRHG